MAGRRHTAPMAYGPIYAPRCIFRALAGLLLVSLEGYVKIPRISRRPSWEPRRSSRPPPPPPCRIHDATVAFQRELLRQALAQGNHTAAARPWGCSAPISNACSNPSTSAKTTWIHPVSERIQAPGPTRRAPTGFLTGSRTLRVRTPAHPNVPRLAAPRQAAPGRLPRRGGPGWHGACYSTEQRQCLGDPASGCGACPA